VKAIVKVEELMSSTTKRSQNISSKLDYKKELRSLPVCRTEMENVYDLSQWNDYLFVCTGWAKKTGPLFKVYNSCI